MRLVVLFYTVLAICTAHRLIAVWYYYKFSFKPIYMPGNRAEGTEMLWTVHGESLLSGVGEDVLFSLLLALVLALPIAGRLIRVAILAGLIIYLAANLEHIRYNFTHINLGTMENALDMTFVKGQLTRSLAKALIILVTLGGMTYALLHIHMLRRLSGFLAIPVLATSLLSAGTFSYTQPAWMQTHPLLPNVLGATVPSSTDTFTSSAVTATLPAMPVGARHNILLIYMEGLSRKSLELGQMHILTDLAQQNISFERYLGSQIVTANGLYVSMTGDFPYFLSKKLKWNDMDSDGDIVRAALPKQMNRAGYHTAFLQSADLSYMSKDRVLKQLGFADVRGKDSWDSYYSRDGWGIDDRALFEHTVDYVAGLGQETPWFVSVLTTGTHSPYNVPKDFMPGAPSDRARALAYLDMAIGELMDGLRMQGLLENTVVIFTSDESRERSMKNPLQDQLMINWLPLIVRHPSGLQERLEFYVDSHHLPGIISALSGDPDTPALMALEQAQDAFVMANSYGNKLFWFDPKEEKLLSCDTQNFICAVFDDVADPMTIAASAPSSVAYFPNLEILIRKHEPER